MHQIQLSSAMSAHKAGHRWLAVAKGQFDFDLVRLAGLRQMLGAEAAAEWSPPLTLTLPHTAARPTTTPREEAAGRGLGRRPYNPTEGRVGHTGSV